MGESKKKIETAAPADAGDAGRAVALAQARAAGKKIFTVGELAAGGALVQRYGVSRLVDAAAPAVALVEVDLARPDVGFLQILSFLAWPRLIDEEIRRRDLTLALAHFWVNGGGRIEPGDAGYRRRERVRAINRLWKRASENIVGIDVFVRSLTFSAVSANSRGRVRFSGAGTVRKVAAALASAAGKKSAGTIRARRWNDLVAVAHLAAAVANCDCGGGRTGKKNDPLKTLCEASLAGDAAALRRVVDDADRRRRIFNPMIGLAPEKSIDFRPSEIM